MRAPVRLRPARGGFRPAVAARIRAVHRRPQTAAGLETEAAAIATAGDAATAATGNAATAPAGNEALEPDSARRRTAGTLAPGEAEPSPAGEGQYLRPSSGLLPGGPFLPPGDLVVVDVETTGWLADEANITEIGAVRISPGQPMAEFSALVNPGQPIPPGITELTGISDAMVTGAPTIGEVLPRFLAFAADGVIVAHNAPFDIGFLAAACEQCGIAWPPGAVIDTAVLSRLLLGPDDVPDNRLATLADHFGARTDPCHRALADAKATATVLTGLLRLLARGPAPAPGPPLYREKPATTAVPTPAEPPSRYDVAAAPASVTWNREAAMVTAIVLIKADVTRIPETAEAIAQIPAVTEVYSVTGEFDLVAMVRVRGHDELGDVIPGAVNKVAGVTHTETHIAFRTYSRHDLDAAFSLGYQDQS